MAEIKPFGALRFTEKAGSAESFCCPPYDIINEEQRKAYLAANPYNVIRLELPKEANDPYAQAGDVLKSWLADGIVKVDDTPSIYIYEEHFNIKGTEYSFKGFISRVKIEEFSKGVVLPHEETLSKAKADRFNLMSATGCNFSQIYSLYIDEKGETPNLLAQMSAGSPDKEFTDDEGVIHRLWAVPDCYEVKAICRQFEDRKLYIADGHHRYETALNYRNHLREKGLAKEGDSADYVMMMLVDMQNPGLVVFPTHRVLRNLENFNTAEILNKCADYFEVEKLDNTNSIEPQLETAYSAEKKAFGFFDGTDSYMLTLKDISVMDNLLPDKSYSLRCLDVSVLHTLVLERLFEIDKENMANQLNLIYTRDSYEAISLVKDENANCCFILNPTRVSEIGEVAAVGEKMPQKSTYFYPKLITGLVMNKII